MNQKKIDNILDYIEYQKQMMFQITSVPAKYLNQKQIKNVSSLWGKIKSLM